MAEDDLVGMENIAYEYEDAQISNLPAGVGCMPGKPEEEVDEVELISGRGLIP